MDEGSARAQRAEVPVTITLEEAYSGTSRMVQTQPDPFSGRPGKRLEVSIPPGVRSKSKVHIDAGEAGLDLYLQVTVSPHKRFERSWEDQRVSPAIAVCGDHNPCCVCGKLGDAAINVGHVDAGLIGGQDQPSETQHGRVLRLIGKGMPRKRGASTGHGDLLATVKVVLPSDLSDEQRELFERLREPSRQ